MKKPTNQAHSVSAPSIDVTVVHIWDDTNHVEEVVETFRNPNDADAFVEKWMRENWKEVTDEKAPAEISAEDKETFWETASYAGISHIEQSVTLK